MPAVWNRDIQQWIRLFNRTCWKRYNFLLIHHKMSQKSLVPGELSFASMPLRYYWLKMNGLQFWNCLPKLVHCSQWQPWGVVTQDGKTKILQSLEMFNFNIYVVESPFGTILGHPKFGSFHVGSPHLMAVTGHSWLTLVSNSNNEVCSPSNNTVSKAFWQKKVLPEQRISCCEGIYKVRKDERIQDSSSSFKVWKQEASWEMPKGLILTEKWRVFLIPPLFTGC